MMGGYGYGLGPMMSGYGWLGSGLFVLIGLLVLIGIVLLVVWAARRPRSHS
ncbi:MAG TPA: sporulation protein YjcZ [Coriobacteriia bacterium]